MRMMRSSVLNEKAGVAIRASSTALIYGFSMNTRRLLRVLTLLLLLMPAGTASARPYAGWLQFDFPAYSSLHDCMWLESDAQEDRQTCSDFLYDRFEQNRTPDLDEATRKQLGYFGEHPVFFMHARLLHCGAGECREAGDIRVGPPEHTWRAPVVQNLGSHLLYHMPSELHGKQHVLQLIGIKRDWISEPFSAPFRHNYLSVRLDAGNPGRLDVAMNWKRCLSDPANASRLLTDARNMILIWLTLILLAAVVAAVMGASRRFTWPVARRAWLVHAITLLVLLSLTFLPPWSNAISLIALPLLYAATLPLDARFMRSSTGDAKRWALLPPLILRLGTILLVALWTWLLMLL